MSRCEKFSCIVPLLGALMWSSYYLKVDWCILLSLPSRPAASNTDRHVACTVVFSHTTHRYNLEYRLLDRPLWASLPTHSGLFIHLGDAYTWWTYDTFSFVEGRVLLSKHCTKRLLASMSNSAIMADNRIHNLLLSMAYIGGIAYCTG